ncbi:hypothetical protein [Candidatus Protofrankia californiensis]|uniref:hypothetical protein n=1 Tax=Candidatus Protofrankia californiensis TaxID=1839754 RepID=UPI001040E631|nr:hypothetical protein [Candidatus Protofrankia californiensis]
MLDKPVVSAGDTLVANGAGCAPAAEVVITSEDGKTIGRTVADATGRFSTVVQFATYRVGNRSIIANCGPVLRSEVNMVLSSSTGGTSNTFVLLLFFLLVGSLVVRRQIGESAQPDPHGRQ